MTGKDPDYSETLRKFYGSWGYYVGLISPAILIVGAIVVYFVIMADVLYPDVLAIYAWISGSNPKFITKPTFSNFSMSYTAIVQFVILVIICNKKDIGVFMRIGSFGVIFIILLMLFIIATGVLAFSDTNFSIGSTEESNETNWKGNERVLVMVNSNFAPLLGILCTGYFLHSCSLPIVRSSKNPEKVGRDMFIGYFLVFISYVIVGTLGYIGFMGTYFKDYFYANKDKPTAG